MTDERTGNYDDFDRDMMEYNARILLTVWASSPITNYANRQYNGLMEDYYIRMWEELILLPAPLAPISATISPSPTSKETPFTAWMAP